MSDEYLARVGDLEVNEDLGIQRRQWRFQRGSAVVMAGIALAALAGAFGSGPLSDVAATGPQLEVTYDRFPRVHAPTELELELRGGGDPATVGISRDYLAAMRIEGIEPQPESTRALPDRLVYTFEQSPPSLVVFRFEPQAFGPRTGTVYGPDDAPTPVSQFIYP